MIYWAFSEINFLIGAINIPSSIPGISIISTLSFRNLKFSFSKVAWLMVMKNLYRDWFALSIESYCSYYGSSFYSSESSFLLFLMYSTSSSLLLNVNYSFNFNLIANDFDEIFSPSLISYPGASSEEKIFIS
jgi:hypothetical protein